MGETAPGVIGSYQVIREIGRGGMGVVYLARDTRLDRDVAIKCLPEELAHDADRLARFDREARTLASLNHPGIASIHGLEEAGGRQHLVLEHVPGETLDERLRRGPLPPAAAIPIAQQIAEAIEAAHEKGIIHRDLKPANIKFVDDETVKVLDFGLAKALEQRSEDGAAHADSPTVAAVATPTMPGAVLGTPGYLSPEQARGYQLDARSDVFSFGCILYEMLTARGPFGGSTASDSIAAVLEREPDWTLLPAGVPTSLHRLLRRCLIKDRRRRLQAIGDARVELAEMSDGETWADASSPGPARRASRALLPWVACVLLAAVLAWSLLTRNGGPAPSRTDAPGVRGDTAAVMSAASRYAIPAPADTFINWRGTKDTWSKIGFSQLIAVSRDGRRIAMTLQHGARTSLFVKEAGSYDAVEVPGTGGARGAFFSPDGEWVGFLTESMIRKVLLPGGNPVPIVELSSGAFDATWLDDDTIVCSTDHGLHRVSAQGGELEALTTVDFEGGERGHHFPHAIAGTSHVLFTLADDEGQHTALLLDGGAHEIILRNTSNARYVPAARRLVYARNGEVLSAPYDPTVDPSAVDAGEEDSVVRSVHMTPGQGGAVVHLFATSETGTLAYAPQALPPEPDALVWVDHEGNEEPIVSGSGHWMHQRLSPDGRAILFNSLSSDGMLDVLIYDFKSGQINPLTQDGHVYDAEWSPDSGEVCFNKLDSVGRSTHLIEAHIGAKARKIFDGAAGSRPHLCAWWQVDGAAPDDTSTLIFFDRSERGGLWISEGRAEEWSPPRELMRSTLGESWAQISPDGALIAYVGFESGRRQIYVRTYSPQAGAPRRVSNDGGGEPRWADSRTLYFREAGKFHRAIIETEPRLDVSSLETLPIEETYDSAASGHQHYDISADGRLLMVKHGRRHHPARVHVDESWTGDLGGR